MPCNASLFFEKERSPGVPSTRKQRTTMPSLRKTTSIILVLAFGVLASVTYLTSRGILLPRFEEIEREHILGDLERAKSLPLRQSQALALLVRDWAWRNDTYAFVKSKNPEYIASNLSLSTFTASGINLITFYDTLGQSVWGAYLAPDAEHFLPLPWDLADFAFRRVAPWGKRFAGEGFQGIARLNETVWILACEQVLAGNGQGPPRGWLLMGRVLDPARLEKTAEKANLRLTAKLAPSGASSDNSLRTWNEGEYTHAELTLNDIDGRPALVLFLTKDRNIIEAGKSLVRINFAIISTACLLIGILAMWLMQQRVLSRISGLARQAKRVALNPQKAYDIAVTGSDEISAMARDVNSMVQRIKEEERFLENMMHSLQVGVLLVSVDTWRIVEVNPYACDLIGLPREEIVGKTCRGFLCSEDEECPALDPRQTNRQRHHDLVNASRGKIPVLTSAVAITRKGSPFLLETFVDVSELEATRRALEESESRYRTIFMNTGTASVIIGEDTSIVLGNSEFYNMSGHTPEEVENGLGWKECFHPDDLPWIMEYHTMLREDEGAVPKRYEARFVTAEGETLTVELTVALLPGTAMSIASLLDITDRKLTERELTHKAFYDAITTLPNRQLFQERLLHAVENAKRKDTLVGVMFLDIDDFDMLNETRGYETGNQVLRMVADRLRDSLRSNDTVARLGQDEFAILTETSTEPSDIPLLAQRVMEFFDEPFTITDEPIHLTVCIGIALFPLDGDRPEPLMRNADLALSRAKAMGRSMFSLYTRELNAQAMARLKLEGDMRRALSNNEVEVWYQPLVNLETGEFLAVEALARWRRPDGSLARPDEFIPFAEGTSLIQAIDLHVMEQACRQSVAWRERFGTALTMSVNLSAQPLKRGNLIAQVDEILQRTGMPPDGLVIEITEKTLLDHFDKASTVIRELAELGVGFALDDFGTGHSSLFQLRDLSLKALKMDKVFTEMLEKSNAGGESLVTALITMAETLGTACIAKGVETDSQMESLRRLGCEHAQGFHFSPPVKAGELEKMLAERHSPQS